MIFLVLTYSITPTSAAHAATTRRISVDDVPDAFPILGCSLREAIDIANAELTGTHYGCTVKQNGDSHPITYQISLPKGLYTYTLSGAAEEDGNDSGDLDITANVHISGQGVGTSIIDGGEKDRVFDICPGGGCDISVTFTDVTIQNGNSWAESGGGIINRVGSIVTLDNSTVSDNHSDLYGGGIYNLGTLNIQNGSMISANKADFAGGGIANRGTMMVVGSMISANTTYNLGGGIYNLDGTVMLDDSTVIDSSASQGGGIYTEDGTVTLNSSTVSDNHSDSYGGGIYNWGTLNIQNGSMVNANTADFAGAGIASRDTMMVNASMISANNSNNYGGGIYILDGTTTIIGSRLLDNSAVSYGGGIFSEADLIGAVSVTGCCIAGNSHTSFVNDKTAIQIATGNWWGSASGPSGSGPGAGDSVGTFVDYSGFLTEPILGCGEYIYLPLVIRTGP